MANGDKKEKPEGWNLDPTEVIILLIFLSAFLGTVVPALKSYFSSGEITFYGYKLSPIVEFFKSHAFFFKTLGFVISGAAAVATIYFNKLGDAVWAEEKARLYPLGEGVGSGTASAEEIEHNPTLEKWQEIIKHVESENPANWRLAIIEADIILDDLLSMLKLPGETIGDKLKAVEPSDFLTLDQAWEAHKARNQIAHQGSEFLLNQREAHRIISLYEAVFKEFHLI